MAEAARLKVDYSVYQETLTRLQRILDELESHRSGLQTQVNRLQSGNTFAGSDVQPAIEAANIALKQVDKSIRKVTAQRTAILQYFEKVQTTASTLQSDVETVVNELPDLFA